MNSHLNNNIALFAKRFPQLFESLKDDINRITENVSSLCGIELSTAKNSTPTASYNGLFLHSAYNPEREAQSLLQSQDCTQFTAGVFSGFGLGYAPILFAKQFPQKTLILIEPDISWFLAALVHFDWTSVFEVQPLVFLIAAPQQTVISLLEKTGIAHCAFFQTKSQIAHNESYFNSLHLLIDRNRQKKEINDRTLEKFSTLWLRNMCRNIPNVKQKNGVKHYKNAFPGLPACLLAAGPSLDSILPHLPEISRRCVIVCVDTALRACLSTGVQPDFIVVVDPQYWNARHLDGLSAPESIVITELASFPSIMRFPSKEILLCSSMYPLGKFIEKHTESKGELGAGGSVATTAWDFARMSGCNPIYVAGLDLGFPEKKTHFKGSTFEERAHRLSNRLHPAETDSFNALYSAYPYETIDYTGKPVLTDKRMALYAWWFESKCCEFSTTRTLTLSPQGIRIPGIQITTLDDIFAQKDITTLKNTIIAAKKNSNEDSYQKLQRFKDAVSLAQKQLCSIRYNAEKAAKLCTQGLLGKGNLSSIAAQLSAIDQSILANEATELAALVFPGEKRIASLTENQHHPLQKSLTVYTEIIKAVQTHLTFLQNSQN